jgi:hypothetical protein
LGKYYVWMDRFTPLRKTVEFICCVCVSMDGWMDGWMDDSLEKRVCWGMVVGGWEVVGDGIGDGMVVSSAKARLTD